MILDLPKERRNQLKSYFLPDAILGLLNLSFAYGFTMSVVAARQFYYRH
jgi:hypothetical protein